MNIICGRDGFLLEEVMEKNVYKINIIHNVCYQPNYNFKQTIIIHHIVHYFIEIKIVNRI